MIYIQSNDAQTLPHHGDAASALYGAMDLGLDYKLISYNNIKWDDNVEFYGGGKGPEFKINSQILKTNIFIGSTEFMQAVWKVAGKNPKLPMNSNREHVDLTLEQVRKDIEKGIVWFVKPYQNKLFSGLVVDKYSISSLREFKDDLHVMGYKPLPPILAEWRIYIHNNKIVDIKNYSGNFKLEPNWTYIESELKKQNALHYFPCAYTMDIGKYGSLIDHWTIIEFNDFWAIGNYGIPNDLYVRMLRDRYFEIIRN